MTSTFRLRFSQDLRVPLQHPFDGRRYTHPRADSVPFTPGHVALDMLRQCPVHSMGP